MSRSTGPDYYELLGVARDADLTTITRAYRRLARVSHPDSGGNSGMFRLLRTAYETLSDEGERRRYDAGLAGAADEAAASAPPADVPEGDQNVAESEEPEGTASWQFADGTARSMVVDPEQLSWLPTVDPDASVRVVPGYAAGRWSALAAAAVALALGVVMVAVHQFGIVAVVAGLAVTVGCYLRAARHADVTTAVSAAALVSLVGTGVFCYVTGSLVAVLVGLGFLAAVAAGAVLAHRYGRVAALDRLAPPAAVAQGEYGRPGDGRPADAAEDDLADRIGADALLPLTLIPAGRIFHGLADPAGGTVSHAVVCGRLVALVDSRYWPSGQYSWTTHGALLRDGAHFAGGDVGLDTAVAGYRQLLADSVDDVRGFVLVASSAEGPVRGGTGPTGLTVGDPQAVVDEIGHWFLGEARPDLVDRGLLVQLYEHRAVVAGGATP